MAKSGEVPIGVGEGLPGLKASHRSLVWRAILAVGLMLGFYALAIAFAVGLLWIPSGIWWYTNRVNYQITLFCLVGAFLIARSILPRRDRFEPPGPALTSDRHPRLFAELRRIAGAASQDMPADVYLVSDVNAWVAQRGGVMGFGAHRVMGLGLPLLQALGVSELRAVLAHEFGHYVGGDVKLGPWIYKTRQALLRTVQALAGHSGVLTRPFLWYAALFFRVTHAVSRHQEMQADALAAHVAGAAAVASGLRTIHGAALAFEPYWAGGVLPVLGAGFLPPLAGGFAHFMRQPEVVEGMRQAVETEIREGRQDPYDTHPCLRDRLSALGSAGSESAPGGDSAADPPAITLLDALPDVERQLVAHASAHVAGAEVPRNLQPMPWESVGGAFYVPNWQKFLAEHGRVLSGLTPASLPGLDWDAIGRRVVVSARHGGSDPGRLAEFAVGAALSVALIQRGFAVESAPAPSLVLVRDGHRLDPFALRAQLSADAEGERWRAFCAEVGIADLDLGRLTSKSG